MADEPQDPTEDPEEAEDAAAEESSAGGEADEDTSAAGGPDVAQDEEGVAEVTEHSTKLSESEQADPISPGQPRGIDPKTLKDRDSPPQL